MRHCSDVDSRVTLSGNVTTWVADISRRARISSIQNSQHFEHQPPSSPASSSPDMHMTQYEYLLETLLGSLKDPNSHYTFSTPNVQYPLRGPSDPKDNRRDLGASLFRSGLCCEILRRNCWATPGFITVISLVNHC